MSEVEPMGRRPHYQPGPGRGRAHRPVNLDTTLPSAEELSSTPHKGDDADRFTLYRPDQVEAETRTVRFDITFDDVIKIRDQFEMVMAAARIIMETTRKHDIGSIRQRIEARREAQSLSRTLARFNGKCPRGDTWKPKRRA